MIKWKTIESHPSYEVSEMGYVRNISTKRILKPHYVNGYLKVSLRGKNLKRKNMRVHRLVAEAFIGVPKGMQVHHIDRIRTNNALVNLSIVTAKENSSQRFPKYISFIERIISMHVMGFSSDEIYKALK